MTILENLFGKKVASHEDVYGDSNDVLRKARYIVKHRMKPFDGGGINADSEKHVQIVLAGTSPLMMGIAYQAMQVCHFPNFDDKYPDYRTKITFIAPGMETADQVEEMKTKLSASFGCLPDVCAMKIYVSGTDICFEQNPKNCFIDIELEAIGVPVGSEMDFLNGFVPDKNVVATLVAATDTISAAEAETLSKRYLQVCIFDPGETYPEKDLMVDIRRARLVNLIYDQSQYLRPITAENLYQLHEYSTPLELVAQEFSARRAHQKWMELGTDYKLSNIYCADCFDYRLRSIVVTGESSNRQIRAAVERNIADLSRTEHARWNVERLLLGFRPFTHEEHHRYSILSGEALKEYRSELKAKKAHVDLVSFTNLRRIDLDSVKYDIFLMFTIPAIMKRCPE